MMNKSARILILGGTGEARLLADFLAKDARFSPLTSLAGATRMPRKITGEIRVGGFGGVAGLAGFLRDNNIALMVDATHPFAARISANATKASNRTGVPCLRLERPPWKIRDGDNWIAVADITEAVKAIPAHAHVLLTVGRRDVEEFFIREDIHVVARMIETPEMPVPGHVELLLARPPFTLAEEKALIEDKRISIVVAKNSGGADTVAKIEAAREFGLPVIMIARPQLPAIPSAANVEDMLALITRHMA